VTAQSASRFKIAFPSTVGTGGLPLFTATSNLTTDTSGATASLGAVLFTGAVRFGTTYNGGTDGDTSTPGFISNAGAFAGTTPTGSDPIEVFNIPMRATAAGTLTFTTSFPTDHPTHDILEYNPGHSSTPLQASQIHFSTASVEVGSTFNAVNDTFTVNQDSQNNTVNPLANDANVGSNTNTLTISAVGATDHGGTVTIASDGKTLKYTNLHVHVQKSGQ
jgi:hypothetical protein